MGRALRSRRRSGRVRQPLGRCGACQDAGADDREAPAHRDRAHRPGAVADPAGLTGTDASLSSCDLLHFSFGGIGGGCTQPKGLRMSAHFTVSDGSLANEARTFSPAGNGKGTLAIWGLVLGSLLL